MHTFEFQNSQQTLEQGVREYHESNPDLAKGRGMSVEAREFFRCHDVAHVVFGCGTSLDDEAVVKIASLFGTTAGFQVLKGYRLHESLDIYRKLRVIDVIGSIVRSVFVVPRTILRCARQNRPWPWQDFEQYLPVPLEKLREEFGIRVAHADVRDR